jgi:dihydrofolate reductase
MNQTTLSVIAAVARNGGIGKGNALLWHESADQKRFRAVTMGCPVIMGRRTWESLPDRFRPLPGRRNIVVTRDRGWRADGAHPVDSFDAALVLADGAPKAFVIGGAQLFALALPRTDELVLTEIDADLEADTFFPAWDNSAFSRTSCEDHRSAQGIAYRFTTYQRNRGV